MTTIVTNQKRNRLLRVAVTALVRHQGLSIHVTLPREGDCALPFFVMLTQAVLMEVMLLHCAVRHGTSSTAMPPPVWYKIALIELIRNIIVVRLVIMYVHANNWKYCA